MLWIVGIGNAADDVAGLNARLGRGRAGDDPLDGRIFDFDSGDFVDPAVVDEHQHEGQDEVGDRTGHADQHLLPAGMGGERAGVVDRRDCGRSGGRVAQFGEVFPGHFDEAA